MQMLKDLDLDVRQDQFGDYVVWGVAKVDHQAKAA